jgi:hypothetical protein
MLREQHVYTTYSHDPDVYSKRLLGEPGIVDNERRGRCREVGVKMKVDERKDRRTGRKEERVLLWRILVRVREHCM